MTIAFDLRALQIGHQNRGIGMYIKSVLENLPADNNKYIFYVFDKYDPVQAESINFKNEFEIVQTPPLKTSLEAPSDIFNFFKLIRHSFGKLRPYRPDVFVQFDFGLGMPKWRNTKKIAIAYDLIPLIKKNEYLPSVSVILRQNRDIGGKLFKAITRSVYYRLKYRLSYRVYEKADRIVSISESTTKSFIELLGVSKARIHTIPLAPVLTDDKPDDEIIEKIKKPFVFYIGGSDSRKKIDDIVHAFNIVRGRGFEIALVLAGSEFREVNELPNEAGRVAILESSYRDDIHLVGFVSNSQKTALYQNAHAFLFCTTYEGFGLPVIEAMAESCPVISYDNSSIPEAAGDAAFMVETRDYVAVARQIIDLNNPELRQSAIKKGLAQSKKFSWANYTAEFKKVLISN